MLLEEKLLKIAESFAIYMGDNYLKFAKQKYNEGLNFKQDNPRINYITIAYNGVWTASGKNIYISSYEKIGYHTGSNAFYEGLKDSGIEIRDLRIKD